MTGWSITLNPSGIGLPVMLHRRDDYWRSTGYGRDKTRVRMMTTGIRKAYGRALDDFGARVHRIEPDQWLTRTPCDDWDVRALVNSVVRKNLGAPELLGGRSAAEIGDIVDGDLLGDDPIKAFD